MFRVKNIVFDNGAPIVCVPIVATTDEDIVREGVSLQSSGVKLIEWRIDYYANLEDVNATLNLAGKLYKKLQEAALLVTYRSKTEGGKGTLGKEQVKNLLEKITAHYACDLIDVEIDQTDDIRNFVHLLHSNKAIVVASHHDFEKTPSNQEMTDILIRMKDARADIAKLAVMPNSASDVTRLMDVTAKYKEKYPYQAVVTMSMGGLGVVSRMAGELTGSCITFGAGTAASAPGQMNNKTLSKTLNLIHSAMTGTKKNIYLIGFMGTGKSSNATALSKQTGMEIVDTDHMLVQEFGKSIAEVFATDGETAFRDAESRLMKKLSEKNGLIVSCGGGVILREENLKAMKESGTVVLLTASPETILDRVKNDTGRPLLEGHKNVADISDMLEARRPNYMRAKDIEVCTDKKTPNEIAKEIVACIMVP